MNINQGRPCVMVEENGEDSQVRMTEDALVREVPWGLSGGVF